jgi:starch-binding outer membrane protein, SusD/RagB family
MHTYATGARLRSDAAATRTRYSRALGAALALVALSACKDTNVPFFNAPTSIPATKTGIQNTVTGVLAASRIDIFNYVTWMYGFGRDATQFQGTESRFVTELLGKTAIQPDDFIGATVWDNQFRNAKTLNDMVTTLPKVTSYTPADVETMTGVAQTLKAFQFMLVAETHDTLGVPIGGITAPATSPAPILCNKDVWAYITALLDSGDVALTAAGGNALPVALPAGFNAVSSTATTFDAFNRALAGKAYLEFAYSTGRPTDTVSVGTPNAGALAKADAAIAASALYNPAALAPPIAGQPVISADPNGVYINFSGAAGDVQNPFTVAGATLYYVNNFTPDLDNTDNRVTGKLIPNPQTNGQTTYAGLAMPCDATTLGTAVCAGAVGVTYGEYPTVSAPVPIIRNEGLNLYRAQVHIGQGDFAGALVFINNVRVNVGGEAPYGAGVAASYVLIRNALLHEQRLSTTYEASGDRTISLRMYNLARSRLTTFGAGDLHTTLIPISKTESDARSGNLSVSCP